MEPWYKVAEKLIGPSFMIKDSDSMCIRRYIITNDKNLDESLVASTSPHEIIVTTENHLGIASMKPDESSGVIFLAPWMWVNATKKQQKSKWALVILQFIDRIVNGTIFDEPILFNNIASEMIPEHNKPFDITFKYFETHFESTIVYDDDTDPVTFVIDKKKIPEFSTASLESSFVLLMPGCNRFKNEHVSDEISGCVIPTPKKDIIVFGSKFKWPM